MSDWQETYDMGKRHGRDDAWSDLARMACEIKDDVERTIVLRAVNWLYETNKSKRESN